MILLFFMLLFSKLADNHAYFNGYSQGVFIKPAIWKANRNILVSKYIISSSYTTSFSTTKQKQNTQDDEQFDSNEEFMEWKIEEEERYARDKEIESLSNEENEDNGIPDYMKVLLNSDMKIHLSSLNMI